jgi:hypothetical protein
LADFRHTFATFAAQMVFAVVLAVVVGVQSLRTGFTPDFFMIWAAQHTPTPYDHNAISAVLGARGCWFPYAPPFLVLIAPLKVVSLHVGFLMWISLSAAAITASLRRPAAPLVLMVPAVFLAGAIGQTSLIMAAALYLGASLPERPTIAGVLFGLAAVIKPQALVLMPVVRLAAGQWRMFFAAALTVGLLSLVAAVAYG